MESIGPIADTIDQELAEMDGLLKAMIFISENAEDHQQELVRHSTVTIAYIVHDKIAAAGRQVNRLYRVSRNA